MSWTVLAMRSGDDSTILVVEKQSPWGVSTTAHEMLVACGEVWFGEDVRHHAVYHKTLDENLVLVEHVRLGITVLVGDRVKVANWVSRALKTAAHKDGPAKVTRPGRNL